MRANILKIAVSLLLAALPASYVSAAEPTVGEITFASGSVDIMRGGMLTVHATAGSRVYKGDVIKTGDNSKAEITMPDESTLYLGARSKMEMKEYSINRADGNRNGLIKALSGKIRFAVAKIIRVGAGGLGSWKKTNFSIETPTAIAGVRGTDFVIIVSEGRTRIVVFEGNVAARNISSLIRGEVMIGPNQSSNVRRDSAPSRPAALSPGNRLLLINQIARPTTANREGEGTHDSAAETIAHDISSHRPVHEVVENAADFSGLTIQEVVATAIKAGADPAAVVYAAVSSGYSNQQVVQAALNAGAPLNSVVNAAVFGGGDTAEITAGATAAGVPAETVATAVATSTSAPPPVTVQTSVTPTGSTTTFIGGGGGAAPSTLIASPSKP